MIIYKITNTINNKVYIGQTTQSLTKRFWQHCNKSPSQDHRSAIYNAIQKYGKENFTIEIVSRHRSIEKLNQAEQVTILLLNTLAPNGYNLLKGGENKECHPETRAKISTTLKGRPIKNRMNGAPKGRPVSEERKKQISETLKGRPAKQNNEPIKDIETGKTYESQKEAAKQLKVSRQTINKWTKSGKFTKV